MPWLNRALVAYWIYTLGYAVWGVGMIVGAVDRGAVNTVISMPMYLVPGLVLGRAAWGLRNEGRAGLAVGVLGTAWVAPGLSFLVALFPRWELNPLTFGLSWGLYWAYYPLVVIGLGLLATVPRDRGLRARLALDSGLVVVAAATLQWYFVVRMRPGRPSPIDILTDLGILFPTELLIAFGAAILVYRRVEPGSSQWPRALGAGLFLSTASDFVYEYRKLTEQRWPGAGGDLLFAMAGAFILTAGVRAMRPAGAATAGTDILPGLTSLPYIAIACVGGLLTWEAVRGGLTDPVAGLVIGGASLMALVILRLALEQRAAAFAQARRAALDARFRALVHRSTDAILVVDSQEAIAYASPAFGRLVDATGALDGRPLRALVPDAPAELSQLAGGGQPQRWTIARPDGPRTLDVVVTDLRHDPAVSGFVVNLRDVTAQVLLEQRLRDSQKLEVVGRLASNVAHDFNNLLTVVMGNAALALAQPAERTRPQWEAVRGAANRGATLARQLMSLGRPARRERGLCDLAAELPRSAEMLRSILPSSLAVQLSSPTEPLPAPIAAAELEQVLLNLALNARDATVGAGVLTLSLERLPGDRALLRVGDTGTGMDDATRRRALEPFFTTKAPHAGTGLGLSTALQLVHEAGGDLEIDSRKGEGTTVTITLPLLDGAELPASATPAVDDVPRGHGRILIVDDERAVREVLGRYLEATGFVVLQATDGLHALEVLRAEAWMVDAMLTDLVMPHMAGPELIGRVRALAPHLPILCMSGNGLSPADADTARHLSAPVIQKPPALDRLAAQLFAVVEPRHPA